MQVWSSLDEYNATRDAIMPTLAPMNNEEWVAIIGRYGSSHIRYYSEIQFMAQFFTISVENQPKLRAKLRINERLREMEEAEALEGGKIIANQAVNPDTAPATDAFEPLPYVNQQNAQKETLGKVGGLYNLKHSIGGQAYNEYLDGFRHLFRQILMEDVDVYEQ